MQPAAPEHTLEHGARTHVNEKAGKPLSVLRVAVLVGHKHEKKRARRSGCPRESVRCYQTFAVSQGLHPNNATADNGASGGPDGQNDCSGDGQTSVREPNYGAHPLSPASSSLHWQCSPHACWPW